MCSEPDKKEYTITGTVEICTDEYRDLIENNVHLKHEAEKRYNQYWDEVNKSNKLNEELKAINKELAVYKEFVNVLETRKTDFLNFRTAKAMDAAINSN